MDTKGGRFTLDINGRTFSGRGKATIEPSTVEVSAEANQDGTAFRTVKPKLAKCDLTFDRGVGLLWDAAMILQNVNLTFVETDVGITHLFTSASWVGTPSIDTDNRISFAGRIGTPEAPGSHFRRFGLQPDWSIAARRGELGTGPVLPGYEISSTSTQRDGDGNVEREWVRQRPAAPAEPFQAPAGHVVKGVSALVVGGKVAAQWIKTREGAGPGLVDALKEAFAEPKIVAPLIEAPVHTDADLLTVYPLADLHVGMQAWARECGDAYDLKIATQRALAMASALIGQSRSSEEAVVLGLGDLFHTNDRTNMTPRSGHILDVDSRWPKIYEAGVRLVMAVVEMAARKHQRVRVRILPGNHDPDAAVTLAVGLAIHYEANPRIIVDTDPGLLWFHRFGRVLMGATHGHTMKPVQMAMLLATDRAKDWGETAFRHFYFGHIHHETAKEVGGVRVESFNTIASKDAHAHGGGYRSGHTLVGLTYHRETGATGRHYVNFVPGG